MARYSRLTGDQIIRGTFENDVLYGNGESGIVAGLRAGRDRVEGTFVSAYLNTGEDNDRLAGTSERDLFDRYRNTPDLVGDQRYDLNVALSVLAGGDGADVFRLFGNRNRVEGDTGKDLISIFGGFNTVNGGLDDDRIDAIVTHSTLTGGAGDDIVNAASSDNSINGGADNDVITLRAVDGLANDRVTIDGGEANDRIIVEARVTLSSGLVITGGAGDDRLTVCGDDSRFYGGKGEDDIEIGAAHRTRIEGNDGADIVRDVASRGDAHEALTIFGGAGTDQINLTGGSGASIDGGGDGDQIVLRFFTDSFVFGGTEGDALLIENGQRNTLSGGDGDDFLSVNRGASLLVGGTGNDYLSGGDNNDTIVGGFGIDTLMGNAGDDVFRYESRDDSYRLSGESITQLDVIRPFGNDMIDLTALQFSGIGVGLSYGYDNSLRLSYGGNNTIIENFDGVRHFAVWVQGYVDESDILI